MVDELDIGGICVVTFRSRESAQNATRELLEILSTFTTVSLVTAGLKRNTEIRDRYEVVDVSETGTGFGLLSMLWRFLLNQIRVCRIIARRKERVILFFGATAYILPVIFARLAGKTVVVEPRGDVPLTLKLRWREAHSDVIAGVAAGLVRTLERFTFLLASSIITYTPAMANSLDLAPYSHKLYTNGARHVDIDMFSPMVPFESREASIGFVGRFDVEKGIPLLAEVAQKLAPEVNFVFVGDGQFRGYLEDRLAAEIDAGSVEITGWVEQDKVPAYLNRLKLLVMPSSPTEGLPSTILEALACGTPVYSTPVSGVHDVIEDGHTGFLMNETSSKSVVDRIRNILARDDLTEVSASGRGFVEERFSFEATVERYRDIFSEIC